MRDFRIRAGFEEIVIERNVPIHTELMFNTDCKILLYLSTKFPASPMQPSMTLSFELLDPICAEMIPQDLRVALVHFIQTGEREALRNRSKTLCTLSPFTPAQTAATSREVEVKSDVDVRRSENVVGPIKNRPRDHPIDPTCKTHSKYEIAKVKEYVDANDGDDAVVDAINAHAVAEKSSRFNTYTQMNVAANSLAIESNETADAAIGDVDTLINAATPASDRAIEPPSFVNGASEWTPLNSSTKCRKRKWTMDATIPTTSDTKQSIAPSAMRFAAFVPTTIDLHATAMRPTAASPTTPMALL